MTDVRVAIVTGAGSGIGAATARRLAVDGGVTAGTGRFVPRGFTAPQK